MFLLLMIIGEAIIYKSVGNPEIFTLKWLMPTSGALLIFFAGRMSKKIY